MPASDPHQRINAFQQQPPANVGFTKGLGNPRNACNVPPEDAYGMPARNGTDLNYKVWTGGFWRRALKLPLAKIERMVTEALHNIAAMWPSDKSCTVSTPQPASRSGEGVDTLWAPNACLYCHNRPLPVAGSPEADIEHPDNYMFGTGNGNHSPQTCKAFHKAIIMNAAPPGYPHLKLEAPAREAIMDVMWLLEPHRIDADEAAYQQRRAAAIAKKGGLSASPSQPVDGDGSIPAAGTTSPGIMKALPKNWNGTSGSS